MSDDPNSLQRSLTQLHAELAGAHRLDENSRRLLRSVLADIERLLREGGGPDSTVRTAPHRLEAMAVGFEADHPSLAASVRQFIDLLGRAGL